MSSPILWSDCSELISLSSWLWSDLISLKLELWNDWLMCASFLPDSTSHRRYRNLAVRKHVYALTSILPPQEKDIVEKMMSKNTKKSPLHNIRWHRIVLDEAHTIKVCLCQRVVARVWASVLFHEGVLAHVCSWAMCVTEWTMCVTEWTMCVT